jgi:5-oxoprolinase (ATP-hydrolysing)
VKKLVWDLFVDTGGTFTDCLGRGPDGVIHRCKVLSSSALRATVVRVLGEDRLVVGGLPILPSGFFKGFSLAWPGTDLPESRISASEMIGNEVTITAVLPDFRGTGGICELRLNEPAPILAARVITGTPGDRQLPRLDMRLATTRGTNALLEEKGMPPVLFMTSGLEDLLVIGDQRRSDLFALDARRSVPLHGPVVAVEGRIDSSGREIEPLKPDALDRAARYWLEKNFITASVCLMHSYRNPNHERTVAERLLAIGFRHVSVSSDLAAMIKIVPRCETVVVDAYLSPIMNIYLDAVDHSIGKGRLHIMTSAGGLISRDAYRPKDSLLSGPAGGVVGAASVARSIRSRRAIAFDMGGTSTDVSRWDGEFDYSYHQVVGRASVFAPGLKIESVAAGGGSHCGFDGRVLIVGPESAGAVPGPACYGAGGPLTLTDVNLLLGRLDPVHFGLPIFPKAAEKRLRQVSREIRERTGASMKDTDILSGFLRIADERMAEAIRRISIREGYDCSAYHLISFGGAGGLHACGVASALGMNTLVHPRDSGLLSARGLMDAVIERFAEEQVLRPFSEIREGLPALIHSVGLRAANAVVDEGVDREMVDLRFVRAEMRFADQEATISIPADRTDLLVRRFRRQHQARYGYCLSERAVELVALRAVASSRRSNEDGGEFFRRRNRLSVKGSSGFRRSGTVARREAGSFSVERDHHGFVHRDEIEPGTVLDGPIVVQDRFSTLYIERDWTGVAGDQGSIRVVRDRRFDLGSDQSSRNQPDVVALELMSNRLVAVVENMGELLKRTALSTNIREREDFSCGFLDAKGKLVVNAPHIPVHLGAMGLCVRTVMKEIRFRPGDVVVTNHPGFGGSHLPDVTLISPVFSPDGECQAYLANRAHHAELGGCRPGSMPPDARTLAEEGVVISPTVVASEGKVDWTPVVKLLTRGPYPTRSLEENLADLDAQMAANRQAVTAVEKMIADLGTSRFAWFLDAMAHRSAHLVRERFFEMKGGVFRAGESLDDGTPLNVAVTVKNDRIRVDFGGSGGVHSGNLNATPAVVTSALLYVLRLLVGRDVPLNEGLMESVDLFIPHGILNPRFDDDPLVCPAVVGGNVETSQRVVDLLIKALGLAACSQGTMNNVIFGTSRGSYYETIAGGVGAGPGFNGGMPVHTHMTNTAITDPEILEWRQPVRLIRFSVRKGSGGEGAYFGGDGICREIEFLEAAKLSVLTQHRVEYPFGMEGGGSGSPGRQWIVRFSGTTEALSSIAGADLEPGDRFVIETPGGGGWGGTK